MPSYSSRDIAAIALLSALWGVLSSIFSPIVFSVFNLPILCDMIGFAVLSLTVWWVRKPGAATAVGLIATSINFIFNPAGLFFLGFTAASVFFDALAWLARYNVCFSRSSLTAISLFSISLLSAAVAGFVIGTYFMPAVALANWGGVLAWVGLHAIGGIIGGSIGIALVIGLTARGLPGINLKRQA